MSSLVERLRRVKYTPDPFVTGNSRHNPINPDGPEAANEIERLREALEDAQEAIASLDIDALGWGEEPHEMLGVNIYPIKEELLAKIGEALSLHKADRHE